MLWVVAVVDMVLDNLESSIVQKMKIFATLLAAAASQDMSADSGETNIIMINMNAANIQV